MLRENISEFNVEPARTLWTNLVYSLGPMILFIGFLYFFFYRGAAQGGSKIFAFGKSRAKQVLEGQTKITFNDCVLYVGPLSGLRSRLHFTPPSYKEQHILLQT